MHARFSCRRGVRESRPYLSPSPTVNRAVAAGLPREARGSFAEPRVGDHSATTVHCPSPRRRSQSSSITTIGLVRRPLLPNDQVQLRGATAAG